MKNRRRLIRVVLALAVPPVLFAILSLAFPLPDPKPLSLVVRDRTGGILQAYRASDGVWRMTTSPSSVPERFKRLVIYKEDHNFYLHPGVDPFAIVRACIQNARAGRKVSGASTITMQVARMLEPKERTAWSKVIEMFRALQLEWKYSKEEILQMYLSMIPLGGNIEGLQSAAFLYYGTPLERLNTAQLFDLILIPNNPNGLRPDKYPERLHRERAWRAQPFFRAGLLTAADSIVFAQTPTAAVRRPVLPLAPHFSLRIRDMAVHGGDVRTTLDVRVQRSVEQLLANHMRVWRRAGVNNGAVLVVENRTMHVAGYAGSQDFSDTSADGQVDAVRALRSPGSTLKPFLYALEMDRGALTPKRRLLDVPYDAEGYSAENYDGSYSGLVYADEALRRSLNVPIVRLLKNEGLTGFSEFLRGLGFQSLEAQRGKLGLSMILGGCGVTLEELVAAYASFPNGGEYAPLRFIEDTGAVRRTRAYSAGAAFMVTDILSGMQRPDLPNHFESSLHLPRIAFKTGTSYGRRDAWTIGYNDEYTVGVWIGNVTNRGTASLVGGKTAAPLLVDILNAIARSNARTILPMPGEITTRDVCVESGKAATTRCAHTVVEYYSTTHTRIEYCDVEKEYMIQPKGAFWYCASCAGAHNYRLAVYREYPEELLSFWKSIGKKVPMAPPHNPACARIFSGDGPKILSPTNGMEYLLTSENQTITLQAGSGVDVREQCWYLNNVFLGRLKAGDKLFQHIGAGRHTIGCLDDKGRLSTVTIVIRRL